MLGVFSAAVAVLMGCDRDDVSGQAVHVVLLGDSTVATDYLPPGHRLDTRLAAGLNALYPLQPTRVTNVAQNGEDIAGLLESGRYRQLGAVLSRADIVVVRYGQNDAKHVSPDEFRAQLRRLVGRLQADVPGVHVILETGLYFDPEHMVTDRNLALLPYWRQTRELAAALELPLSDVYYAMAGETRRGNWDLRVRSDARGRAVMTTHRDHRHPARSAWFSNGHPNLAGNRVAAAEQLRVLCDAYPWVLPRARDSVTGR